MQGIIPTSAISAHSNWNIKMAFSIFLALLVVVAVGVNGASVPITSNPGPQEYPGPAPQPDYDPQIGQTNVDGYSPSKNPYCHMEEKVVFENQCEPYTEKTCWTQNQEECNPVMYKNCTGVIQTKVDRVCFNVNELVCSLVETIHYETLEETYQVQRCFTGKDRICDTIFKIDTTTKDDYQCIDIDHLDHCYMEEKVINDVTCTNSVEFDCKRVKSTKNDGYGAPDVVCERTPKQDCYEIPRKVQVEVCKTDIHPYCEKFPNTHPFPVEEQNCHFEPKKICELETKSRPKKAKKYSYTKDCKEQPRLICDQCETRSLQPVCDFQERLTCSYIPKEQCSEEHKQYCHKVEKINLVEVCDSKFDTRYL